MGALPPSPRDLALLLARMDAFRFTRNGTCRTIVLLARRIGLSRDGTRAPMQVRNGWRPAGRRSDQPQLHLKMDEILSKRWGPPQQRNIVERDVQEVLELDVIATNYEDTVPDVRMVEIKSGNWGFPEVFKIFGWLKYLDIPCGELIVKKPKETKEVQEFYRAKAKGLDIDVIQVNGKRMTKPC